MSRITFRRTAIRVAVGESPVSKEAVLAVEEPLEIRVCGRSLVVAMRTPGHDTFARYWDIELREVPMCGELPEDLVFHVSYLGGDMPVLPISFSRPAGRVVAQYDNFLLLGLKGYREVHNASYEVGPYLASEVVNLGPFELLSDSNPTTGIPTVIWRIRVGEDPGYTLFDLHDRPARPTCTTKPPDQAARPSSTTKQHDLAQVRH